MSKIKFAILGAFVIVTGAVASSALYTVHQVEHGDRPTVRQADPGG